MKYFSYDHHGNGNVTGRVHLECENNGYYSASYWTEKTE